MEKKSKPRKIELTPAKWRGTELPAETSTYRYKTETSPRLLSLELVINFNCKLQTLRYFCKMWSQQVCPKKWILDHFSFCWGANCSVIPSSLTWLALVNFGFRFLCDVTVCQCWWWWWQIPCQINYTGWSVVIKIWGFKKDMANLYP